MRNGGGGEKLADIHVYFPTDHVFSIIKEAVSLGTWV